MAKGQVTTDDLASGIKSFGGLSSLGGAPRPARDNPFRDTRTEAVQPVAAVTVPEPAPETPRLEVINGHEKPEVGEGTKPLAPPRPPRERKPTVARATERIATPTPLSVPNPDASMPNPNGSEKKTEIYTERVTALLNADLRDRAEALAKDLQRRRTQKGERITTNTVIRVALRAMLESFQPSTIAELNTESELYEAVLQQWSRK